MDDKKRGNLSGLGIGVNNDMIGGETMAFLEREKAEALRCKEELDAEVFRKAIDTWGIDSQIEMVKEELAELIVALCKSRRKSNGADIYVIADEVADVEIMLEQLKIIFERRDEGNFRKIITLHKEGKIRRLSKRLEAEND